MLSSPDGAERPFVDIKRFEVGGHSDPKGRTPTAYGAAPNKGQFGWFAFVRGISSEDKTIGTQCLASGPDTAPGSVAIDPQFDLGFRFERKADRGLAGRRA